MTVSEQINNYDVVFTFHTLFGLMNERTWMNFLIRIKQKRDNMKVNNAYSSGVRLPLVYGKDLWYDIFAFVTNTEMAISTYDVLLTPHSSLLSPHALELEKLY